MGGPSGRRAVLAGAVAAGIVAAAGTGRAQTTEVRGTLTFEDGAAIPAGHVEIRLEDPAIKRSERSRVGETRVDSDGKSKSIAFTLPLPASLTAAPTLLIVARLEREDGWLLARGSTKFQANSPLHVTLYAAIY
jgi:hypothetical protein